ncbi:hypothetical protein JHK82_037813 [Glycine max]|uniref:Protein FAF-like, chloroplastic n=1 Tax=Glycine soja TaxID=3848 RepID=A0A445ID08_GLYSO|nr:protein FAF-like, chloroplastic [Glycine soja]KAG5114544.1 hypothetical protein JHK82_037813 [Glycine max]KAG4961126.1 hypothetical protein JHK87_037759 [Glycine soja]KAH1104283.1 hypothetical protein GYH30_037939 [Glycine max]KHN36503.1 Protein FAF-like, chloroplastic [Glycine soja]RZB83748.1 Protein FAF-like, chloroplastic [Glycine soja]
MSTCMSKKIQGQSLSIEEENMLVVQKQGIVTILGSNHDAPTTSLRRTLSADMSSKTWLSQNGFSLMKKTSSSEELSYSSLTKSTISDSSSSDEDNSEEAKQDQFQIWNTIQKEQQHEDNKPGQVDVWSSILVQKANEETLKLSTTPYVHPLVRRSKSCLSEKSLEICTESLGSETGSDGFSSYSPSETEEKEEEKEEESMQITHEEDFQVPKQNYAEKKSLPRSFPPPLPSLHMRSHRDNGRLFLQAVSVPSQNNFCAQRENGRLVLTFADVEVAEEEEEEFDEAEEFESVIEEAKTPMLTLLSSGFGLALMMNKPIGLLGTDANVKSPKWSEKFNDVVNFKDVDTVQHSHPLPPRPRQHGSIHKKAFNAYEYYWRTKPTTKVAPASNTFTFQHNNNYSSLENNLKSCKDSRRSFLIWEPYCIAT